MKFFSVSAIFLFALVQGVVSQDSELVPLGGECTALTSSWISAKTYLSSQV
jgi:hypothetical protein